jgi:hypothetical protein
MRHSGTLPGSSLRLCSNSACANGDVANGSAAAHHHYNNHHHSLRRSGNRSTRTSPKNATTPNSPSPPPPPPPRYPAQYPTLPMNGNACHHYQSRYGPEREASAGGTLTGRERSRDRNRESGRRMEQLSASSHQQRQEELEIQHGVLARHDMAGYHA